MGDRIRYRIYLSLWFLISQLGYTNAVWAANAGKCNVPINNRTDEQLHVYVYDYEDSFEWISSSDKKIKPGGNWTGFCRQNDNRCAIRWYATSQSNNIQLFAAKHARCEERYDITSNNSGLNRRYSETP